MVALGLVRVPARHRRSTCCSRHRDRFPRAAAQIYATFDLGVIGYWAIPTAPPWYAAQQGLMDDGRTPELRRMMVEYGEQFWKSGLGASVRCPGRQSPGRHALAALRHVRDGRARAQRHRAASPARSAGPTPPRSALALVYLGEHYVVDLAAGARARRGASGAATPRRRPPPRRALARAAGARGAGAAHDRSAPEQTVDRAAARRATPRTTNAALEFSGRTVLTLCGFLVAMIAGALLPAAAARRPRRHLEPDRGRLAAAGSCSRFVLTVGMFGGYVAMFRGVFGARASRIGWRESYLITMAGAGRVADLRRRRRRRARAAGLGAAPGRACAKRVVADKTISFLVLTYFPYAVGGVVCGFGLRLRALPRRGAVHDDRRARR